MQNQQVACELRFLSSRTSSFCLKKVKFQRHKIVSESITDITDKTQSITDMITLLSVCLVDSQAEMNKLLQMRRTTCIICNRPFPNVYFIAQ